MHHFRGVAIFLIVVLHIYGVQGTDSNFTKQFEPEFSIRPEGDF